MQLDNLPGDPEPKARPDQLADGAVALLGVKVQHDSVAVALERSVEMAAQNLAIEEADRHLAGRSVGQLLVALQLDPLDGGERNPGGFVVLQAAGVVNLDQEVGLVEIEIAPPARLPLRGSGTRKRFPAASP